jgi:hypothetical protein
MSPFPHCATRESLRARSQSPPAPRGLFDLVIVIEFGILNAGDAIKILERKRDAGRINLPFNTVRGGL